MSDWRTEWIESALYAEMWSAIDDWLRNAAPYDEDVLNDKYGGAVDAAVEKILAAVDEEARAAEREACAQIAAKIGQEHFHIYRERDSEETGDTIAAAIRARGQEDQP